MVAGKFDPLFKNPHVSTIAGNFWPRELDASTFAIQERYFETDPGVQVLVHTQRPSQISLPSPNQLSILTRDQLSIPSRDQASIPSRDQPSIPSPNQASIPSRDQLSLLSRDRKGAVPPPKGELILVHGLEGSSQAGYARSLAQAALHAGFAVHRFNMRSCGGTEAVSGNTLYHSGQTADVLAVARTLKREGSAPLFLIGFSLGGNVVLKLAGELGEAAKDVISGLCAISTPIDLAACVRALKKPSNRIYADRFVKRLIQRVRLKEQITPGSFDLSSIDEVQTVYDFDDRFTARSFGFGTADRYYATQSANQFLAGIRVPTLIVHAKDDPLVPVEVYRHPALTENPCIQLLLVDHGGHLGFISKRKPRFWLDGVLVNWLEERTRTMSANFVL